MEVSSLKIQIAMNLNSLSKIAEKIWLSIAIFSAAYAIYLAYAKTLTSARPFIILAALGFGIFTLRYALRKRIERKEDTDKS